MRKLAFIALAGTFALSAMAADKAASVGVINDVKGAVTVSTSDAIQRATKGMALPDGASVLVSSDGAATLALNNGCTIALQGSQHVQVDASLKCDEIQASVTSLFPAYQVAQAPLGGGITPPSAPNTPSAGVAPVVGGVSNSMIAAGVSGLIAVAAVTGSSNPVSRQ